MRYEHTPHDRRTERERRREDAYNRDRPDASAGWEAEYAHQGVEADLRADGGTSTALPAPGDRVRDRESEDGDELVIIATYPDTRADDYRIAGLENATVADVNDGYDPGGPVLKAVYAEAARDVLGDWRTVEDLRDAVSFGAIDPFAFPAGRLKQVTGGDR